MATKDVEQTDRAALTLLRAAADPNEQPLHRVGYGVLSVVFLVARGVAAAQVAPLKPTQKDMGQLHRTPPASGRRALAAAGPAPKQCPGEMRPGALVTPDDPLGESPSRCSGCQRVFIRDEMVGPDTALLIPAHVQEEHEHLWSFVPSWSSPTRARFRCAVLGCQAIGWQGLSTGEPTAYNDLDLTCEGASDYLERTAARERLEPTCGSAHGDALCARRPRHRGGCGGWASTGKLITWSDSSGVMHPEGTGGRP
jgi:hypothetical protein